MSSEHFNIHGDINEVIFVRVRTVLFVFTRRMELAVNFLEPIQNEVTIFQQQIGSVEDENWFW